MYKTMASIHFDRDTYKAGETATITYADAPSRALIQIITPTRRVARSWPVSGSGSVKWAILADTEIGRYSAHLYDSGGRAIAHDTASITGGAPPTEPPSTGFTDTGKVTPSTIEVDPAAYDVMFKLTGYKDKIITGVVVSEGATKTVSATLELEVTPPEKAYLTVNTSPTGALVMVNGVSCGTTPVTRCELSPGSYQLTITKSGYETVERAIGIAAGEMDMGTITLTPTGAPPITKKTVTFKSVPSGASINVVSR